MFAVVGSRQDGEIERSFYFAEFVRRCGSPFMTFLGAVN